MDAIPVISQLRSLTQFIFGQREQARQTQINFSRQCPIISQARSAVEAISGDEEAARETQMECLRFLGGVVNSIPVVGHISGGIRYAVGDTDGGDQAMKAASKTTAVMAGGFGGFFIGGPVGAIGLGIGAGAAMDATITVVDTAVHWSEDKKVRTFGFTEPFSNPKDAGKWFDAIFGVALDGVTAFGAGQLARMIRIRNGARGLGKVADKIGTAGKALASSPVVNVIMKVLEGRLQILSEKEEQSDDGLVTSTEKNEVDSSKTIRIAGCEFVVRIENKIVTVKDASGIEQVLQENKFYTVIQATGKVEEILIA